MSMADTFQSGAVVCLNVVNLANRMSRVVRSEIKESPTTIFAYAELLPQCHNFMFRSQTLCVPVPEKNQHKKIASAQQYAYIYIYFFFVKASFVRESTY